MPANGLKKFLDSTRAKYLIAQHSAAYTAHEMAAAAHVSGWNLAKTVIVSVDGQLAMVVIPASGMVDIAAVERFLGIRPVVLVTEAEFRSAFPDCEEGAMPPFGNLYGMPVYVDQSLSGRRLTFNAGNHREVLTMDWKDYNSVVRPLMGEFMTLRSHFAA